MEIKLEKILNFSELSRIVCGDRYKLRAFNIKESEFEKVEEILKQILPLWENHKKMLQSKVS